MAPIAPNDNPWVVMTEYTASNGCGGSFAVNADPRGSWADSSVDEYVTTSKTSSSFVDEVCAVRQEDSR